MSNKILDLLKAVATGFAPWVKGIVAPIVSFISNIWGRQVFKISLALLLTLLIGLKLGTYLADPEVDSKVEKGVEVEKTGAITITLPGIVLDEDVFKFQTADLRDVPIELSVPGKLVFNAERSKVLAARVAGRVERIFTFDGSPVKTGQVMADFYSPDYVSAQQEFLLSMQTVKTLEQSALPSLMEDAKSTLEASSNRLRILGAANEDVERLRRGGQPTATFPLRAPIDGVVIKRVADPGSFMNVGDVLATIADPKALWFMGNVYEQDIPKISKGQVLKLKSESYPDREFIAKANYVSATIDPVTHALMIRCDVDNTDGALRPEMFVSGKLEVGQTKAVVVPRTAIIQVRNLKYAIIQTDKDTYRRVPVKGFDIGEKMFAINDGLKGGDKVLIMGSTLMNQRFLKQED
jgi:Cu(I)/Ag(I) efflux system membrane fusion protein